jgi:hypothetical protein
LPCVSRAEEPRLPPAAAKAVSFKSDIQPLLETSCLQCHGKGKNKGGFSVETRESLLKGGDSGPAVVVGKSGESLLIRLVSAPAGSDEAMPKKGSRLTPQQIGMLRNWIDDGLAWDQGVTFAKAPAANLQPRAVVLPRAEDGHPLDLLLAHYFTKNRIAAPELVDDRLFARRAWLDAIGLLPPPAELEAFLKDQSPDKRQRLVKRLLADNRGYAEHWLTFWNDLLRNDYKGTGFIDGGRKQITGWLYAALLANRPYDQFVRELTSPAGDSEGFVKGIVWRGSVPAAMSPPMQAAQNVSQVFLGVNLKCAGCHDSFVSDWTLADAYGLAAIFSDQSLEMVHCDRPTGKIAAARFLYPQIGEIDAKLSRPERLARFSQLLTSQSNGRLSRNVVNRLWARLIGRGLVEPLDDMEKPAWSSDLLDWLAEDLASHKYDLRRTLEVIMTSRAYQLPVVEPSPISDKVAFLFKGPLARRLSAEQFADAISTLTEDWAKFPSSIEVDYTGRGKLNAPEHLPPWVWTDEPVIAGVRRAGWQIARARGEAAQKLAGEVQKLIDADKPAAEITAASAKAKAAADEAAKLAADADGILKNPERAAQLAAGGEKFDVSQQQFVRHKVVFRQKYKLDAVPAEAYAIAAASQKMEVVVNGKPAAVVLSDAERGARTGLFDIKPLLVKGENVISVAVDSHTERPNLNIVDREKMPATFNHLNQRSGVTFFASLRGDGWKAEWTIDDSWICRRAPESGWQKSAYDDKGWAKATALPSGQGPLDEGPAIADDGRLQKDRLQAEFAYRLPGLMALATHPPGGIRASLRTSDPLQLALGRPNREMVTTVRQDSATTIQALELTNGATLDSKLKKAAAKLAEQAAKDPQAWVTSVYQRTLCRGPSATETKLSIKALGEKPSAETISDFLWALTMQPEFQYVH